MKIELHFSKSKMQLKRIWKSITFFKGRQKFIKGKRKVWLDDLLLILKSAWNAILKSLVNKCNFTFSLQMMMISGSHNTKQTFFLRIPNTFANHYPSSFFSFYLKEHYYTVHGIGEAKEKMGQNLWGEEEEAVTKALKIHNLWVGQRGWSLPKNWVKRG